MDHDSWTRSADPSELVRFASLRVARQHLCLALGELCRTAVETAERDGRQRGFAKGYIELVRAWCFFEVADRELEAKALTAQAELQSVDPQTLATADPATQAAHACLAVAAWQTSSIAHPLTWGLEVNPQEFADAAAAVADAVVGALEGAKNLDATQARLAVADHFRRVVPFPARINREWLPYPGVVFSGDFVLSTTDRMIFDAIARSELARLPPERAVAFDVAQAQSTPEPEGQVRQREFVLQLHESESQRARSINEDERSTERYFYVDVRDVPRPSLSPPRVQPSVAKPQKAPRADTTATTSRKTDDSPQATLRVLVPVGWSILLAVALAHAWVKGRSLELIEDWQLPVDFSTTLKLVVLLPVVGHYLIHWFDRTDRASHFAFVTGAAVSCAQLVDLWRDEALTFWTALVRGATLPVVVVLLIRWAEKRLWKAK